MTFPETRVDLNRLIKKMKPELGSESFQTCKNTFSASARALPDFGKGKGHVTHSFENSARLKLLYRRGVVAMFGMSGLPWKNPPGRGLVPPWYP